MYNICIITQIVINTPPESGEFDFFVTKNNSICCVGIGKNVILHSKKDKK